MPYVRRLPARLRALAPTLGLAAVLILCGGSKPVLKSAQSARVAPSEPVAIGAGQPSTIDHFGVWIEAARSTFARVRDYQCVFTKRERIDGTLQDEQTAQLLVRNEPFSVHVRFTAPRAVAGKEGSYVQGRHDGKMRAKTGGALGLVGYVTIDPRDKQAMQGTRHSITEAGLGNLIERLAQGRRAAGAEAKVIVSEYTIGERGLVRFDLAGGGESPGDTGRTVVYFDKNTNLPVRYESYDNRGELIECFAYSELRFNVGLTDAAFP